MLSNVAKLCLTSTAIAPIFLTFGAISFAQEDYVHLIFWLAGVLVLTIVCLGIIDYAQNNLEDIDVKITRVEAADRESLTFLLVYLLPLFTADLESLNFYIWVPILGIFSWITATGYNYHFNPVLNLWGWHFYRVETDEGVVYVLLTKRELRSALLDTQCGQLTEYILIEKD
ncbi:hypothetical protein [Parvularcula lutaonensis]|uniref:Uncharacterized protein n=1 Tax=Parvularcula lutaonensis TaxID=491923 RepID=A0ABV7MC87_9PROT|nr:hypothetical protein [Parvularcula lutaonensis]GGY49493.1 hypothetical protein GCM10007148_17600 [Parvularcula lutaonensis]